MYSEMKNVKINFMETYKRTVYMSICKVGILLPLKIFFHIRISVLMLIFVKRYIESITISKYMGELLALALVY